MNKYLILIFFSLLIISSCSKDKEVTDIRILAEGNWSGTFEGDDSGTWTMTISSDGTLTGELLSTNVPGVPFRGTGTVTANGDITADIMVTSSTSKMVGTISESSSSGTWSNDLNPIFGTWQGSKE